MELPLETPRLTLRPLSLDDIPALQRIGGQQRVARMLLSVKSPWAAEDVRAWIERARWRGRPGFRLAICLKGGSPLIGSVGMGGTPATCAYFLDPDHWGKGYATEAMQAFLAACFASFGIDAIEADHFADNPASGRVLQKLGFVEIGRGEGRSAARAGPSPNVLYRLTRPETP
ncbi:MAG: GNAT family N-acetyltransferase [Pseudomonadota bacterium]